MGWNPSDLRHVVVGGMRADSRVASVQGALGHPNEIVALYFTCLLSFAVLVFSAHSSRSGLGINDVGDGGRGNLPANVADKRYVLEPPLARNLHSTNTAKRHEAVVYR